MLENNKTFILDIICLKQIIFYLKFYGFEFISVLSSKTQISGRRYFSGFDTRGFAMDTCNPGQVSKLAGSSSSPNSNDNLLLLNKYK